jgi:hypothetical protein
LQKRKYVLVVILNSTFGRTMREASTAKIAGVATKAKIKIHRNQHSLLSPVFLLKEQRKMLSIAS